MASRPNILIVCTDQQRTDSLGCYGSGWMETPGFDRVARSGTRFARAYCPSAVCTPSRVSLMTGRYPMRHGIWSIGVNAGQGREDFLSHRLGHAGYQTCLIGKAHFEAYGADPGETNESIAGHRRGYGDWTGPYYGFETAKLALGHTTNGLSGHYGAWVRGQAGEAAAERFATAAPAGPGAQFGGEALDWDLPAALSNSAWTGDETVRFLERDRDPDRPFFLFASFQDPHHPHAVPRDYAHRVDPAAVPLPRPAPDLDALPPHHRAAHEGRLDETEIARRWPVSGQHHGFDYRAIPEAAQRLGRSYYYTMVRMIDDQLARIWACLDAQGLTGNTLVFVTSDHGELLGDHGLWMKGPFHFEELARIPLLAMGPGIAEGSVSEDLASLVDIAPTCLSAAGIGTAPGEMDGIDLRAARRGPDDTVLCETVLDWDRLVCRSVIGARHKLTWYSGGAGAELFDLAEDPGETRNLAARPEGAALRADMLGALVAHDTRMQASDLPRISYA